MAEVQRTGEAVYEQLEEQYTMPIDLQRGLIRSEHALSDQGVQTAVRVARTFGLPLQGVNVIRTRSGLQVFVNSDGVRWRLHTDPRHLRKSHGVVVHHPTPDEPWIQATATIEFEDGSQFVNEAWMYLRYDEQSGLYSERSRRGDWNAVSPGDRCMAAITKAKRRAGVDAVGVALPIFEDVAEWSLAGTHTDTVDAEFTRLSRPGPGTIEGLMEMVTEDGYSLEDLIQAVGWTVDRMARFPDRAARRWREVLKEREREENETV